MVCALTSNQKVVQAVLYSMMVLTFLLSGMTTWLYAIGILISAYVLCLPFIRTKKSSKIKPGVRFYSTVINHRPYIVSIRTLAGV